MPSPVRRTAFFCLRLTEGALFLLAVCAINAQQVGSNVNMVTGTQWPGGDPFLQRQNEPSMAISSRNPLHMLAGDNDYRSVDLPSVSGSEEPTGDAWLGLFKSFDGGQTWTSTLIPGYPQDQSLQGVFSPIHGLGAGADPTVRAGTNGMLYYSGLAFNRQDGGASKVFVATLTDNNNKDGGDSIEYLWTTVVDTGTSNLFEDKPSIAVDIPRSWSGACIVPALPLRNTQIFRAGTVYAAWTQFTGEESNGNAAILYSRSIDCGLTWSRPQQISGTAKTNQGAALAIDPNTGALYITWRVFASTNPTQADAIMYVASFDGGNTFTKAALAANISAFDQGNTFESFRTNDYPVIAVDAASHIYLAWSQRGVGPSTTGGDARIVVSTGTPTSNPHNVPLQWSTPEAVDLWSNRGHQFMPAMAFSAGKLTVAWYDLRDDDLLAIYTALGVAGQYSDVLETDGGTPSFGLYVQDPAPPYSSTSLRQTLDVRAAQASPGNPPVFFPSVQVTQYAFGSVPPISPNAAIQQLEIDPPNLPMFQNGTLPFFGDYIDVAGPTFIPNPDGTWRFNNLPADPDFTHVVWADNRDVVPPADGNWANYTPPTYGTSTTSVFDPTQRRPACTQSSTGNTGDRNQNIYTAQLAPGLVLSAPGNAKQLGAGSNGQLIQRQFPIVVTNTSSATGNYTLIVNSQPAGGTASFLQSAVVGQPFPLTQIQVQVPPLSSTSRGLFVTSTNAHASVTVIATSTSPAATASVTINGDPNNPPSSDTNIAATENYTPTIATPNIANPNIANPNIANPNIANPNIANPNIANPNIANPNIANPNIANPNIANPNIANPNIANQALSDGTITDGTWAVTNTGNTSSAYAVNVAGQLPPPGVTLQLVVYQNYNTPLAQGCTLAQQSHFVPVANITNVTFSTLTNLLQPAANNPALPGLALQPGQTAYITLRVFDANTNNPAQALIDYNPITQASPVVVSQGANTGTTVPPVTLTILTKFLPQATLTGVYPVQTLQATGGSGTRTWSIASGTLPAGITLSSAGVLAGTPTGTAGTSSIVVQVKDTAGDVTQQPLTLAVNPVPAITTTILSPGDDGTPYSQALLATGGTSPLSAWSISSGTLPSGLSLNGSTIGGTLAAAAASSTFIVKISDANNVAATQALTITVNTAPAITTTSLAAAEQGRAYASAIATTGGTAPLAFTPQTIDGVTLTSVGGFTGTPTAAGSFPITVTVTDALGVIATQPFTLAVNAPLALNAANLPAGTQSAAYPQQQLVASNGVSPYSNWTWTAAPSSTLPPGLLLNMATGIISGTPTTAGTYSFVASVTDALGATASQTYTITVNAAVPTITTTSLPNGQFNSPYSSTLSNTGGTAPYTWSLGTGSVLPTGLTLNASSGILSGAPAQAGIWSLAFTVTDANSMTANTNLFLTVGLATAYAGGNNCYMPYPTTPMFYETAQTSGTWGVTPTGLPAGQMTIVPGTNVLAGCLFGMGISSGSYQLQFTSTPSGGTPSTFSLPLAVVAQDNQDNGSYYVNSGGVASLPPSGFQQGVVASGQSFTYQPGVFGSDAVPFGGNFLFGFTGMGPQVCDTGSDLYTSGSMLTAPAQPGRYDLLFDGTTLTCPQAAFPTSPAPIVFKSVDVLGGTVAYGGATITGVQLSSSNPNASSAAANVLEIEAGGTSPNPVNVAFAYTISNPASCPGCITQLEVGLNSDAAPQLCVYSGIPPVSPPTPGTASIMVNVPNTPGRYYIGIDVSENFSCVVGSWANGQPGPPRFIGVVDVW